MEIWFCIKVELAPIFGEFEEMGVVWEAASDSIEGLLVFALPVLTNGSLLCCAMKSKLKRFVVFCSNVSMLYLFYLFLRLI
jgi:hypothetical protein